MKRAIGFNLGLRGDLIMSTVAARSFKEQYPNSHLTLGVGPQYSDMLPLFHAHPLYDAVHCYTTYDGWPGPKDVEYLEASRYDMIFHGMPQHRDQWWEHRHQYAEAAHMVGLPIPADINPVMNRWFGIDDLSDFVAFAPFGGNGQPNDKMLPVQMAQKIVGYITEELGVAVIHLGAKDEPRLEGAFKLETCYFDSVRALLGTRLLIHCDTGLGHVAGAYNHPSLGLYAHRYYGKDKVKNIQPLHSNFRSVDAPKIEEIDLDLVFKEIRLMVK